MEENDPHIKIFDLSIALYKIRMVVLETQNLISEGQVKDSMPLLNKICDIVDEWRGDLDVEHAWKQLSELARRMEDIKQ